MWVAFGIDGFRIITMPAPEATPNILAKSVERASGAWLDNYGAHPWMMVAPLLVFLPLIIVYTSWVYRVMRGKLTEQQIREKSHSLY